MLTKSNFINEKLLRFTIELLLLHANENTPSFNNIIQKLDSWIQSFPNNDGNCTHIIWGNMIQKYCFYYLNLIKSFNGRFYRHQKRLTIKWNSFNIIKQHTLKLKITTLKSKLLNIVTDIE